jgi:hypothetical protein
MEHTFFDKESYDNDIDLETNEDVLDRIYKDDIKSTDMLPIEFYFLTDTNNKAINFKNELVKKFPDYEEIIIRDYDGDFEISGKTDPKQMSLQSINQWNKLMWDFGYEFDCKLDGWQVGT